MVGWIYASSLLKGTIDFSSPHLLRALSTVLSNYTDLLIGLRHTFWITAACAIAAFFCCLGLEWKSVKKGHGQEGEKVVVPAV